MPPPDAGSYILNQSGIPHRIDKVNARPRGVAIREQPRERWRCDDGEATIVYDVPWSTRKAFVDWVLGYVTTVPVLQGDGVSLARNNLTSPFLPDPLTTPTGPGAGVFISEPQGQHLRIIPDQHPEFPWLYASECDLVEPQGVAVRADNVFLQNADGSIPTFPAGPGNPNLPIQLPAAAYVDNRPVSAPPPVGPLDGIARYAVKYTPRPYDIRTDAENLALAMRTNGGIRNAAPVELARWVERSETYSVTGLPISRFTGQVLAFTEGPFAPNGWPQPTFFGMRLGGAVAVPEAGVLPIMTQQLIYTLHDWPDVPKNAIMSCVGKVNGDIFDALGTAKVGHEAYPAGTLLCLPPSIPRRKVSPTGRVTWTITLRFDFRPRGWNRFAAADGNFYAALLKDTTTGDTAPVFKPADFTTLFLPPLPVQWQ